MTIEEIAKDYRPGDNAKEVLKRSNITLLVGISGAGKDTIQSKLLESQDYYQIITHTTRSPRSNNGILEQNGREYHFVSVDEMRDLLLTKQMVEINQFGDKFYGASIGEFEKANRSGKIAIVDIDIHGISAVRELAGENVRSLFILPPSYDEWLRRLSRRYSSNDMFDAAFEERKQIAISELEWALSVPYYHFIINDDLDRAVRVVDEVAHRQDTFNRRDDEARLLARDLLEKIKS